jgi:hypothetical protein
MHAWCGAVWAWHAQVMVISAAIHLCDWLKLLVAYSSNAVVARRPQCSIRQQPAWPTSASLCFTYLLAQHNCDMLAAL